ncbi:N-acetyltransferase GCN5 [Janibacter hoylei PVAS-1]|uniref:N-acetyltransferase GCN5 n=1 Tax=Janibacter hoylei PVAS-1 TaxID=1210046 RepID=K1E574_9MICO|nr:N-acetyltransferase GCN5 [Janibacter hoylei PVAS-1]
MLRTRQPTRLLGPDDVDAALDLCARDPAAHVFVASRILDGGLGSGAAGAFGWFEDGQLASLVWTVANVVPVGTTPASWGPLAAQVRKVRRRSASFLGPRDEVRGLWDAVGHDFPPPRAVRGEQPLLATATPPVSAGDPARPPGPARAGARGRPRASRRRAHVHPGDRLPALHRQPCLLPRLDLAADPRRTHLRGRRGRTGPLQGRRRLRRSRGLPDPGGLAHARAARSGSGRADDGGSARAVDARPRAARDALRQRLQRARPRDLPPHRDGAGRHLRDDPALGPHDGSVGSQRQRDAVRCTGDARVKVVLPATVVAMATTVSSSR